MQIALAQKLRNAFLNLLEELDAPFPQPSSLAAILISRDPKLAREQLLKSWTPVAREMIRERSAPPGDQDRQMFLPGFELDEQIPVERGYVPLAEATITTLRESIRVTLASIPVQVEEARRRIEERAAREVWRLRALIEDMSRRRPPHESLTVAEYVELRMSDATKKAKAPG